MNHETMQENVYAFYDGQLPAEKAAAVQIHLKDCRECSDLLAGWKRIAPPIFNPLRIQGSENFVYDVMRKVRGYAAETVNSRWPQFVRWAYPALAFSVSVFIGGISFALQPAQAVSVDNVLIGESTPVATANASWFANESGEEQLITSLVNR